MDYREIADMGFEDGFDAALNEVSALVRELHAEGNEHADAIFQLVWERLRERQAPMLAERKARRAARDAATAKRS